jgi:hypothetical protein
MPLGIAKLGYFRGPSAAPPSTFMVKNSLSGIDAAADNVFRHYAAHYLGDDSSENPCFAWVYRDASDGIIKVTAFKIDSSDGSLTIGTPGSTTLVGSEPYLKTENTDAKTRSTSGWTAAGAISFYGEVADNLRLVAFTVNLSTLAVTLGTAVAPTVATGAGSSSIAYVDNNRFIMTHRNTSDGRNSQLFSRSGTTVSLVANGNNTTIADGGIVIDAVGFAYNSGVPQYRAAVGHDGNNLDGTAFNTVKFDNTTYRTSSTLDVFSGTETNSDVWLVPLDTATKAAIIQTESGLGRIIARTVDITWAASGTNPSHTFGSELTLTGTDYSPVGFGPGQNDNEFVYYYDNSGTLKYRVITNSGTTLSQGSEIDTGLSVSNNTGTTKWEIAKSASGDYAVGIVDNTGSNDPDVFVLKLT